MADITSRLEALARGPKPFRVVAEYTCGKRREVSCHSRAAADNHAARLARDGWHVTFRQERI
jgi:hypothetical protein